MKLVAAEQTARDKEEEIELRLKQWDNGDVGVMMYKNGKRVPDPNLVCFSVGEDGIYLRRNKYPNTKYVDTQQAADVYSPVIREGKTK